MDSSRRAVESYWRSRMIDAATSDEDKVTPVYKLEEICELLRSSHASIVKEISEFVLKRLDHKSPVVKQKALRLIKYSVSKAGIEFRREMQRHSVAIRQLFHYKGHPDPLKGDALNKAVRDMAHEAILALFSAEDDKPAPQEGLTRRIEGFGNTSYDKPSEDKKSFLSEVVGFGSASIKQGLTSFTQSHISKPNDVGNYRSPNLRRSLTTDNYRADRYEPSEHSTNKQDSYNMSTNDVSGPWGQDSNQSKTEITNTELSTRQTKTREEILLETIVSSGGVRLHPTRDAIHVFMEEAVKLDMIALSHAIEGKLTSPSWQARVKAICVLDSILRKDDDQFAIVTSYFEDNIEVIVQCSESPQASLREKAHKILALLNGNETTKTTYVGEKQLKVEANSSQLPDLIDANDIDTFHNREEPIDLSHRHGEESSPPFIDDLFGGGPVNSVNDGDEKTADDPFADVSFHANEGKENADDLFQGMTFSETKISEVNGGSNSHGSGVFDFFGSNPEVKVKEVTLKRDIQDLMAGLSFNEKVSNKEQPAKPKVVTHEDILSNLNGSKSSNQVLTASFSNLPGYQTASTNLNSSVPVAPMMYGVPPGVMFNQAFPSQMMNYGAMGNLLGQQQQQLLATMANFQQLGNMSSQYVDGGLSGGPMNGGYNSALPDIFHPNNQPAVSLMGNSKTEDTRAFDFISDHVAAAQGPKRVL